MWTHPSTSQKTDLFEYIFNVISFLHVNGNYNNIQVTYWPLGCSCCPIVFPPAPDIMLLWRSCPTWFLHNSFRLIFCSASVTAVLGGAFPISASLNWSSVNKPFLVDDSAKVDGASLDSWSRLASEPASTHLGSSPSGGKHLFVIIRYAALRRSWRKDALAPCLLFHGGRVG